MNSKRFSNDAGWAALLLLAFAGTAQGALTTLATEPLPTATSSTVLPNLMFVLDNSGSMDWDYMPDIVSNFSSYGTRSSQCNEVYYNPSITYSPPVKADGTSYPNADFTAALPDGFTASGSGNSPVNLGASSSSYYYAYSGTQKTLAQRDFNNKNSTFYKECDSSVGSSPGNAVFSKVTVTSDTTKTGAGYDHNTQNFANWYSYYQTRMLMMKTAAGRAFKALDDRYRVGFATINNPGPFFLNPAPFDSSQKTAWYDKLYTSQPSGSTPLRTALSNLGKLYAGKYSLSGVTIKDPVQYSCQQNFGLLSTDGFWNTGDGFKLDGTAVGNQDGTVPRPYFDGAVVSAVQQRTQQTQSRESVLQMQTTQKQKRTSTLQKRTGQVQMRKSTDSGTTWTDWSNQTSCTWDTITNISDKTLTQCRYVWGDWVDTTANCAKISQTSTLHGTVWKAGSDCQYAAWTDWAGASSCSPVAQSAPTGSPLTYTVHPAVECQTSITAPYANADSCTATTTPDANGNTTQCQYTAWSAWANVAECKAAAQSTSPNYSVGLARQCQTTDTGWVNVDSCTPSSSDGLNVTCQQLSSGGSSDTLSDIAQYYYMTDLRTPDLSNCTGALGKDVCANNVPSGGQDSSTSQHLTLFTLGLGARGRMVFSPSYLSDSSGDYYSVKTGAQANPPTVCSWQSSGDCNWPLPVSNELTTIDDLWHSAVNGRGTYFSATNPASLAAGLASALAGIDARVGASASATTSSPNITQTDNLVFSTSYTTVHWDGEMIRQRIDTSTGLIPDYDPANKQTYDWAARDQLDSKQSRVLYTYDGSASSHLKPFAWDSLSDTEKAYFSLDSLGSLSQFCTTGEFCLTTDAKNNAAGQNLVAYLGGDRSNEGSLGDTTKFYRQRTHLLGDMVDAAVAYVKTPIFAYGDKGYSGFVTSMASRQGMAYAVANDGMLHAFNADTGAEAWAYVPALVLPKLYKLADKEYYKKHQYFLDGSPVVGDICASACGTDSAVWKTILVGGQGGGGRGYYALDITDPASPKALWEFTNDNLGYTFGNPVITKLKDGTWVVLAASGYNNVSPGDGQGRLFVINAVTGNSTTISTGVGGTDTPSGLARINAWVDNGATDNTTLRVYGGDLLGNLWRFDVNGDVGATGYDAQLLATLKDNDGNAQPITSKPEIGLVLRMPVVFVGTGRHLSTDDTSTQQSMYAIKDTLPKDSTPDTAIYGNPRTNGHFVQQTQTSVTCPEGMPSLICTSGQTVRTSTKLPVDFYGADNGWFVDFPDSKELVNTDPVLVFGTLLFDTNVYQTSDCSSGGYSFRYFLDYRTGGFVSSTSIPVQGGGTPTSGVVGGKLGDAIASSPSVVKLPGDNGGLVDLTPLSTRKIVSSHLPHDNLSGATRRLSWREIDIE